MVPPITRNLRSQSPKLLCLERAGVGAEGPRTSRARERVRVLLSFSRSPSLPPPSLSLSLSLSLRPSSWRFVSPARDRGRVSLHCLLSLRSHGISAREKPGRPRPVLEGISIGNFPAFYNIARDRDDTRPHFFDHGRICKAFTTRIHRAFGVHPLLQTYSGSEKAPQNVGKFAIEFIVKKEINVVCNEIVLCLTLCSRKDL